MSWKDFFGYAFSLSCNFFYMILYNEVVLLRIVKSSAEKLFLLLAHESEFVKKLVCSCKRFEVRRKLRIVVKRYRMLVKKASQYDMPRIHIVLLNHVLILR